MILQGSGLFISTALKVITLKAFPEEEFPCRLYAALTQSGMHTVGFRPPLDWMILFCELYSREVTIMP